MNKYITAVLAAFLLCVAGPLNNTASAAEPASTEMLMSDHKIIELTDKYLAMLNSMYPEEAARAGMLGYQSALDPRTKQGEMIKKETILALQDTLNKLNYKKLSPNIEIAYHVLKEAVNRKAFDITVTNRLAKDPLWYLEAVDGIYDILIKDYKPFQERLTDALKRTQALPYVLAQAKENLDNPPDLVVRVALERAGVAYTSFNDISVLMNKMAADEYTKDQIKIITAEARRAVKDYFDFLKDMMDKKSYVDFRLGPDNFKKLMYGVYSVNTADKKLAAMLEKEVETSRAALIAALTPIIEPALSAEEKEKRTSKKGVIEIHASDYYFAAAAYNKGPKQKDVLNTFLSYFTESEEFFAKNNIFNPASLKVFIAPAPKFLQRKNSNAYYMPPFPLLGRQSGDLLVALPDSKEAAAILPVLFTYSKIKISSVGNLSAGYNMLYSPTENFREKILKVSNNPFYINGWVKYSLNLAKEKGFLAEDEDLIHIAWHNYKAALLALADFNMHTLRTNYSQSLEQLMAAGVEKEEASADLDDASVNPAKFISAILGEQEFARLRGKYQRKGGAKFNIAAYHDKLLSTGRIPLPVMERAVDLAHQQKEVDSFFNTLYF